MSEERRRILDMLAQGKITVPEAEKLLSAIDPDSVAEDGGSEKTGGREGSKFKYLRVLVEPGPDSEKSERVNIRVPLNLIRAGLKWAAFIPRDARTKVDAAFKEKGIDMDFEQLTKQDMEEILVHLNDLTVEVEGKEKVRIYCE